MAVPYVVGTLALMKSVFLTLQPMLLHALVQTTQPLVSKVIIGLVVAMAAVQMLEAGDDLLELASPSCRPVELALYTDEYCDECRTMSPFGKESGSRATQHTLRVRVCVPMIATDSLFLMPTAMESWSQAV